MKYQPFGAAFGMTWNRWYPLKSYLRSSLWIIPLVAVDRMLEKMHLLPEGLALARVPDRQGLGGSTVMNSEMATGMRSPDPTGSGSVFLPTHSS